jgi:cell division protein FtsL
MRHETGGKEMNNHYRRPRMDATDMFLLLVAAGLILAFAIIYETATTFRDRCNEIHSWQSDMMEQCEQIKADQAEMWGKIEGD